MKRIVFELLKNQLLAMTYEAFTVENVSLVFSRLLTAVKQRAAETDTKIDDWILEKIEELATSTQAVERFVEVVRQVLQTQNVSGQTYSGISTDCICTSAALETAMAVDFCLYWIPKNPF